MTSILEQKIDREFADLVVRPYVYHIRAYGSGPKRRILGSFNSITIVDLRKMAMVDVEHDVGELIEGLTKERMMYGNKVQPATWMMKELLELGYYGIAICDRRDNFSRKRGRTIAKGRLLKHLRLPELPDGTKW